MSEINIFGINIFNVDHRIINVTRNDIGRAAGVFAEAFRNDPLFGYAFGTGKNYDRYALWMFKTWVNWGVKYASVWATQGFESVAIRRFPGSPGYNWLNMISSGIAFTPFRLGFEITRKLDRVIGEVEKKHAHIMKNKPHIYCQNLATKTDFRGMGFGNTLMNHTFQKADQLRLPCYLETTTENTMLMHQAKGYELADTYKITGTGFMVYAMIRKSMLLA